jgi:hypothetical protein
MRGTHRVTLGMGHNHVVNSIVGEGGDLKTQALPSWELNAVARPRVPGAGGLGFSVSRLFGGGH